jgi:hypothetical protein
MKGVRQMSSISRKLSEFTRSPRGQQLIDQVQRYAARPENRRKIEKLRDRLSARRQNGKDSA